ncbi:MAG TPA: hypothetical protein VK907_10920 [Phnomibacter sp.]|nr:hypothetical protein [Phnomibacter sp.]
MVSPLTGSNGFTEAPIFNVNDGDLLARAKQIFSFQYQNNEVYRAFCDQYRGAHQIKTLLNASDEPHADRWGPWIARVPFLPISFFKTHRVVSYRGEAEKIFTSSGTTGLQNSRHYVKSLKWYEAGFVKGFTHFYGDPAQYAFICLLPSYLEREGSSLIYMAQRLIALSRSEDSGFYLKAGDQMADLLAKLDRSGKKTILLGVSFALLDFAENNPIGLSDTFVMETGGMKGRREEITRMELHDELKRAFGLSAIHSEYGMTELMSQAYSPGGGRFRCPPWMRVLVRDEDDPALVHLTGTGLLCIIDLANVWSCAFLETQDLGRVHPDGSFEVLGRLDHSDIRGCSLLSV